MLTIAIAQTRPGFLNPDVNHQTAIEMIRSVTADVYLFPELYLSGYTFSAMDEVEQSALQTDNRYFDDLKALSAEKGVAICGGYAEAGAGPGYARPVFNSSFFIGDGELIANYRKTHLFFRETQFFTPGDTGFSVFDYRGVKFGMMICYDWFYPESARTLAMLGAQVILHPANLVLPYCQRSMYARCVENRVFVATANRVGSETNTFGDDLTFTGGSQLVTPHGEYSLTFNETEIGIRSVRLEPEEADEKALNEFNRLFADRRPELYR